jgi:UDP-N-acetylbacillosamine N-acetyltransferase
VREGYILCAGAQGRIIAETWRAQHPGARLQLLDDDPTLAGETLLGVPVVGPVNDLDRVVWSEGVEAVIALGNNPSRLELDDRWRPRGAVFGRVVHPNATIMPSAELGEGATVFAGAIVNTQARVGRQVLVNTAAIVEHDCVLEDGCSLGPGVTMGGRVHIGRCAFLAAGVTVAPRVNVGAGTVVGAGATVVADLPPGVLAYGTPARVVRELGEAFDWRRLL